MSGPTRFNEGDNAVVNVPDDIDYAQVDGEQVTILSIEEEEVDDIIDAGFSSDTEEWYEVRFNSDDTTGYVMGAWLEQV